MVCSAPFSTSGKFSWRIWSALSERARNTRSAAYITQVGRKQQELLVAHLQLPVQRHGVVQLHAASELETAIDKVRHDDLRQLLHGQRRHTASSHRSCRSFRHGTHEALASGSRVLCFVRVRSHFYERGTPTMVRLIAVMVRFSAVSVATSHRY